MTRIAQTFAALRAQGRKALIPYVTAGDPYADATPQIMAAMARAGADVIELGVPFSDPMADGPVIQQASERALSRGVSLTRTLEMVREFRRENTHTPVVLMGYANPVERYGVERFVRDARDSGVDGVLTVDYPPEACEDFAAALTRHGLDPIFLLAPTSTDARIERTAAVARGYVYYVALKGVTGAGHLDVEAVSAVMPRIRRHVSLPVGVGFGIRDAATAVAVAAHADAVVIGSALVQRLHTQPRGKVVASAAAFVADIRDALDASTSTSTSTGDGR